MSQMTRLPAFNLTDTGPLVALVNANDPSHAQAHAALRRLPKRPLLTTWPCLTEAMYLLHQAGGKACSANCNRSISKRWRWQTPASPNSPASALASATSTPRPKRCRFGMAMYLAEDFDKTLPGTRPGHHTQAEDLCTFNWRFCFCFFPSHRH